MVIRTMGEVTDGLPEMEAAGMTMYHCLHFSVDWKARRCDNEEYEIGESINEKHYTQSHLL